VATHTPKPYRVTTPGNGTFLVLGPGGNYEMDDLAEAVFLADACDAAHAAGAKGKAKLLAACKAEHTTQYVSQNLNGPELLRRVADICELTDHRATGRALAKMADEIEAAVADAEGGEK
jgi:hypothetical protein